jgi:hypothetical protein
MKRISTPWVPPGLDDRRSVCRYSVARNHAWIGWWEGETFRHADAELLDISLRGARLIVTALPPPSQSVWFCPPSTAPAASPSDWLEARVIEARKRWLGPRLVRLIFRKNFPYETFKAVVYGPEGVGGYRPHLWIPEGIKEGADQW